MLLVHSSFKSLGLREPEEIVGALLSALGKQGTLLMPALTYRQEPLLIHDTLRTPSCVGYLSEYFRTRKSTLRSLHPTHSVCAVGGQAGAILADHWRDITPCGANSPFNRLMELGGKILMIGCGLRPSTTMHAVEEYARPPYLFGPEREYTLTDATGHTFQKTYTRHGFTGYWQRYDRMEGLLSEPDIRQGQVGDASCHLIEAAALKRVGVARMKEEPYYFVEKKPEAPDPH